MPIIEKGHYQVRLARTDADLRAAQRLRWLCFVGQRTGADDPQALDADRLDPLCRHLLIEERGAGGPVVACFRLMVLENGAAIEQSYSAQFYNLAALADYPSPMIEVGRFCVHPAHPDPDILRIAWGALARVVEETRAGLLFGCSSFLGADAAGHADAFAMLGARHLAPRRWLPRVKAPEVFRFARRRRLAAAGAGPGFDPRRGLAAMPPLLRTYLMMGGWVSDHAVLDRKLDTMHVFTGVEIAAIPPARARALRALAG